MTKNVLHLEQKTSIHRLRSLFFFLGRKTEMRKLLKADRLISLLFAFSLILGPAPGEQVSSPVESPPPEHPEEAPPPSESSLSNMLALDTVLALVNGEAITLDDLSRAANPLVRQWPDLKEQILNGQLESLIDRKLILMEARRLGARVRESAVTEAILSLRELKVVHNGDLAQFLLAKGLTYRELFRQVEEELVFGGMIRQKILPKVRVSPAAVEQYYQRNIDKFTEQAAIHCYAISFFKRDNPDEAAALQARAAQALKKINEGAYFPDIAQEFSEDPERADKGGDWGWIGHGALEKKASDAAFSLEEGQYSGLVEGDAAYWILWVKEKREKSVVPPSEAWKEIELAIKAEKQALEIRRWGQRLRQDAAITYPVRISEILGK
jgi:parvulin-like peptidyl-prolyl isomerase